MERVKYRKRKRTKWRDKQETCTFERTIAREREKEINEETDRKPEPLKEIKKRGRDINETEIGRERNKEKEKRERER